MAQRVVGETWDRLNCLVRRDYHQLLHWECDKAGGLLEWLLKREHPPLMIIFLRSQDDTIAELQAAINMLLQDHLVKVYEETGAVRTAVICCFLDQMSLPRLTVEQARELETELLVEEVKEVAHKLAHPRVPGPDGLLVEYYQTYVELLIPFLKATLQEAHGCWILLQTFREAQIIMLPKPRRDQSDHSSYRPLSMLRVDAKILTKALATGLR
ncbi:hypothetical protein NDU88_006803 [Pleurodeles waltl]|uniref:Uncharacterized protein n=1 Tax=Pleurodeles waltl TaxID=8319 RepID=A0AAV7NRC6_PLEWA|nr:hypothetical protein NDU88_006803 [Pleurodeles waltl]